MSFLSNFFSGDRNPLEKYSAQLDLVNQYKDEVANLSQEQMRQEILEFKKQISELETDKEIFAELKKIAPRVFALTREAGKRSIGQFHYNVQVAGGFALAEGKIAEMKTGEGKTLAATLPLVLYALAGRGSHLVTVNDYLARWQASLMGQVYHYLGLSVASIQHEASFLYDPEYKPEQEEIDKMEGETQGLVLDVKHMRPISRREAYAADITYGTNNEYGFDYLRDNMAQSINQLVQRELFFAIVDEVDSILIDEARTPLIISMPDSEPTSKYYDFARMVDGLEEEKDYTVDDKHKSASLTDEGINKVEAILKVPNIYDTSKGVTTIHHIEQAVRARGLFKKDRDYVVREGEIIIVDEFTGRLMFGRRYSEGLHQAIEAKEGVKIQAESKTLATITFQNLFRLYKKLSGMTGTAKTEEEEFFKIYQLTVEQIPTNKPMVRTDKADVVYKTEAAKFNAIAKEVKERHKKGQPILIGTVSIAKNEMLAEVLKSQGLQFELLNAKNHEREAHIVSQAGRLGQITLATNIAGRGVDILLGGNPIDPVEAKAVTDAGGLHILGTERHESRRIDNQLRGRAGRQGDPGSSQFFVSMEDDLLRLFGGERMKSLMTSLGLPDEQPIEAKMVSRSIESAQKKIEGLNFDTRKHVLEFDDVLNHQRNHIYKKRRVYLGVNQSSAAAKAMADKPTTPSASGGHPSLAGGEAPAFAKATADKPQLFADRGGSSDEALAKLEASPPAKGESPRLVGGEGVGVVDLKSEILGMVKSELAEQVEFNLNIVDENGNEQRDWDNLFKAVNTIIQVTPELQKKAKAEFENAADQDFAVADVFYKAAADMWEAKEKELGKEVFQGAQRFVALQAVDNLWMEHLDTMDHLRDSVRLRGYGQRDPLVEYKKEGYVMFQNLLKEINKQIVNSIFHISVNVQPNPQAQPSNLTTNLSDGSSASAKPSVDPKYANVGRNDRCPCGSGKKFKKCHGKNA